MNISHFFIDRPIFACVISMIVLLMGAVAYFFLPVAQFPDIVPPTVSITASYPGASAETVVDTVAVPIEKQVNGVDNMLYMASQCTSDGELRITVTFAVGTDPDMASVLVQNRVKIAEPVLPDEVTRQGVTTKKQSTNIVLTLCFLNPKDKKDRAAGKVMSEKEIAARLLYLTNYVSINIKDQLARVDGVGDVHVFNTQDFSMRIWLNPDVMSARQISVAEIVAALQSQNVQVASGRIGEPPASLGTPKNIVLSTQGRYSDVEQFEDMVLRADTDGSILRLKDVAAVELGAVSYAANSTMNGIPTTSVAIYQNPGANSIQVAKNVMKALKEMDEVQGLFSDEVQYELGYDATEYVRVSMAEVQRTLLECIVIVVLIVFVFLQDWRAALIPSLTVPVSLVGCFFMMACIGFTINSLTLFGLILVIGIVVDDAIIVVENTQRIINDEGLKPYDAARKAMDQVSGPIISTTFVLMAIFIPTSMVPGITGSVYRQFALTIAGAVLISAMCALTFAPALAAILLRKSIPDDKKNFFFRGFNCCFNGYVRFYLGTVRGIIAARWLVLLLWFGLLFAIYFAFMTLPSGFIPNEDQGVLFVDVKLPEGSTQVQTQEVIDKMQALVDKDMTGIERAVAINGFSLLDSARATNSGFCILALTSWDERYPRLSDTLRYRFGLKNRFEHGLDSKTLSVLYMKWNERFAAIPEAKILVFPPPPILGLGNSGGLEYQLLDRADNGSDALYQAAEELCERIEKTGMFSVARNTFDPYAPRYYLDIDRNKVMKMGIPIEQVFSALQGAYGSIYVNDFNVFENVFHVTLQGHAEFRDHPDDVLRMKFKGPDGQMVPIHSIAEIREITGPQRLPRYQLYPTAYIQAQLAGTTSTGQGMAMLRELSKELPTGFGYDWTGMSYQENAVGQVTGYVFALCVVFAFFVLAAQYESWSTPIIILMAVPLGIGGALLAVALRGIDVNIYTQIGFILMVGLSAKNAILITEFAVEKHRAGEEAVQSAYEAGRLRLRPIMMTSFAFILGIMPLLVATGAGAVSRHAIGTPVFGGMLTETMVGVYVTPVLFVLLTAWSEAFIERWDAFSGGKRSSRFAAKTQAERQDDAAAQTQTDGNVYP